MRRSIIVSSQPRGRGDVVLRPWHWRRHRLGVIHAGVGFGRVPGLVRPTEAHPAAPGLVALVGLEVPLRALPDVDVRVVLEGQHRRARDVGLVGEPLLEVLPITLEESLALPHLRHVAHYRGARPRPADLVHVVEAVGIDQVLAFAQVAPVRVQVRLAEETGPVAEVPDGAHPGPNVLRHGIGDVVPHARVVRVLARRQRHPRRDADGCRGDAIGEAHPLRRDAVEVRRAHPVAAATHRIPALLVGHDEQDVRMRHKKLPDVSGYQIPFRRSGASSTLRRVSSTPRSGDSDATATCPPAALA